MKALILTAGLLASMALSNVSHALDKPQHTSHKAPEAATIAPLKVAVVDPEWGITPNVPSIYIDGLTRLQVANLTVPERLAVSMLEASQQTVEAFIQAKGCVATSGDITVYADTTGVGDTTIDTAGSEIVFLGNQTAVDPFRGDKYRVLAATGKFGQVGFTSFAGVYAFNKSSSIMQGSSAVNIPNPLNPNIKDVFTGTVIKDFFNYPIKTPEDGQVRTTRLDWGLQQISKQGYPQAKYWQRSHMLQEDGVEGTTRFKKLRIAGGPACIIDIKIHGNNNPDYFYQTGFITVAPTTKASALLPLQ